MKTYMRYIAVVFAVAMIVCAISSVSAAYPDVDGKHTYSTAIETMTNLGILGGYEDGTFRPDQPVRRDEMAKIVFVAYTTYKDAGEGTVIFPDVPANSWAKGYISWCAGKNIVGGYEDGTFRPEGNITYDEALKMVCAMLGYTDFNSELWPQDVRTKGLIDLELGEKLEGIAGDAALTRAQIVQLVFNSLDKPMYQAPKEEDKMGVADKLFSNMGVTVVTDKATLKENIWKIETVDAQIIATENYGLFDAEKKINTTKTEKEDIIVVRFTNEDDTYADKKLNLSDVGLEAYAGKTDALLTLKISIIREIGKEDEFVSASLAGKRDDAVTGGYAPTTDLSEEDIYLESGYLKRAKYGLTVNGIDHYDDEYKAVRRLTYFDDMAVVTNAHVDSAGKVIDAHTAVSSTGAGYSRWRENLASSLGKTHTKYISAIDSDSDGWYDYVVLEYEELFKVVAATSKTVTFEYYYKESQDSKWVPVPDYKMPGTEDIDAATGAPVAGTEKVLSTDLTFSLDKVTTIDALKVGDIIQGYQLGDTFTVTKQSTKTKTAYLTKYALNQDSPQNTAISLSDGSNITLAYGSSLWASSNYNTNQVKGVLDSLTPRIGINPLTGTYNYVKFTLIEDKAIFAEKIEAEAAVSGGDGYKKAILLYVTEATEPQINEETKEYETFYPAYLLIDGRTYLVNLNPTDAINGFSGDIVADEGSEFRASIIEDGGVQRIMNANKLVTYTVDGEGYFSLKTTNGDVENKLDPDKPLEIVIPAAADNNISVDESTGIFTISNGNGVIRSKIMKNADSVIYYPDTKKATGKHEYMEYYKGNEIPMDFAETAVRSDIYLTLNEDKGIYYISALVLAKDFEGSTVKSDYTVDARQHLYAVRDIEAVVEGSEVFAAYTFKKIDTLETVEAVNNKTEYDESKDVQIKNKIFAWDAAEKDYVEVVPSDDCKSLLDAEVISDIMTDEKILFTTSYADGIKIDDTVSIVALVDRETAELSLA